jgi:hypothetical protein
MSRTIQIIFFSMFIIIYEVYAFSSDIQGLKYIESSSDQRNPKEFFSHYDRYFKNKNWITGVFPGSIRPYFVLDWLDRVYTSSDFKKIIIAKYKFSTNLSVEFNKLYKIDNSYLVHLKKDKENVFLSFTGFSMSEAYSIISDLNKTKRTSYYRYLFPFNTAIASEPGNIIDTSQSKLTDLNQISDANIDEYLKTCADTNKSESTNLFNRLIVKIPNLPMMIPTSFALKNSAGCLVGVYSGIYDSTIGSVTSLAKGVYRLSTDIRGEVGAAIAGLKQIYGFVSSLGERMGPLADFFKSLPFETQVKLGCEIISSLGINAAITFTSFGIATPAMISKVITAIKKTLDVAKYPKILSKLNQMERFNLRMKVFIPSNAQIDLLKKQQKLQAEVVQLESIFNMQKIKLNLNPLDPEASSSIISVNVKLAEARGELNQLSNATDRIFEGYKSLNYFQKVDKIDEVRLNQLIRTAMLAGIEGTHAHFNLCQFFSNMKANYELFFNKKDVNKDQFQKVGLDPVGTN